MKTLEVYDPPMCCATGVCGTDVDQKVVQFAADISWLKGNDVSVLRYNLAQQPAAFADNPRVAEALKTQGNACLPMVLVDGQIATLSIYPTRDQLASLAGIQNPSCCGGGDTKTSCCCE